MSDSATRRTIGFRVEPTKVHYAVVEGTIHAPILVVADSLPAPKGWEEPAALQWYRSQAARLIDEHAIAVAVVRDSEASSFSKTQSLQDRCRIEGVLIEVSQSKGVKVSSGRLRTISANMDSKAAKKYLENDDLRGLDWSDYSKYPREAILAAVSGLEDG